MRISDWSSDVCSSDLVVQQAPVHQRQRLLEPGGDGAVGGAGFGAATGMVVADDERRGVVRQRPAPDLARMHLGAVDRAAEQLLVRQRPVAGVEDPRGAEDRKRVVYGKSGS